MKFELEYNGIKKTFSKWGLSKLKRKLTNQICDTVSFSVTPSNYQDSGLFDPESTIKILRNDKLWFYGIITQSPNQFHSNALERIYEVSGPWWYLQNLVFQQDWKEAQNPQDSESTLIKIQKGRLILGQDINNKTINNGQQIKEIINYAIDCGAPIQLGKITPDVTFPVDEVKDLSCAEAVSRVLRWSPDALVWFDYSTTPYPTLNVTRRIDFDSMKIENLKNIHSLCISPRHDLKKESVVLKYEKTHYTGQVTWTTTEIDAYPLKSTGKKFKSVVLTIDLEGMRGNTVSQKIKTDFINTNSIDWWKRHLPDLKNVSADKIEINHVTRKSELQREIQEGSIAKWMDVEAESDTISAMVSYETQSESIIDREIVVKLNATNATSNTYRRLISGYPAENTPTGLAKKLYESVSQLQYDGDIEILHPRICGNDFWGKAIEIDGTKTPIQEIREDVEQGKIHLKIGPAKHLGPCDLVELLRTNRKRKVSSRSFVRSKGEATSAAAIQQSTHGQNENTLMGSGKYQRLEFVDSSNTKRKVIINAKDIPEELVIQLREEDVAHNGYLKKRLILSSDPYGEEQEV